MLPAMDAVEAHAEAAGKALAITDGLAPLLAETRFENLAPRSTPLGTSVWLSDRGHNDSQT